MSNPNTPQPAPGWFRWVAAGVLLVFAVFVWRTASVTAGGADSSGYLNGAQLLAAGDLQTPLRLPQELGLPAEVTRDHFTPLGFVTAQSPASLVPLYPSGLPLHLAAGARLLGWQIGPRLILTAAAVFAVWLTYLLGRELGLDVALSAAAAVTLATFPVFLFAALQPLSDTLATTWCVAGLYSAVRSRRQAGCAALAGLSVGIAVWVRPTNLLIAPAVLILLGRQPRRICLCALGALPAAAFFFAYNRAQYGGVLQSGYGPIFEAFAWRFGALTAPHFAQWLALLLPAILLPMALVAVFTRAIPRWNVVALLVAFSAVTGLYLFYDVSHEVWWCLRFILPVVPSLIILGVAGLSGAATLGRVHQRKVTRWVAAGVMVWAIAIACYWTPRLGVLHVPRYELAYEKATRAAAAVMPANAIVACFAFSGAVYFYTEYAVLRCDAVNSVDFARYAERARAGGVPICALVFEAEEPVLRERCPGNWKVIGSFANARFFQLQ